MTGSAGSKFLGSYRLGAGPDAKIGREQVFGLGRWNFDCDVKRTRH